VAIGAGKGSLLPGLAMRRHLKALSQLVFHGAGTSLTLALLLLLFVTLILDGLKEVCNREALQHANKQEHCQGMSKIDKDAYFAIIINSDD
jgi:hypothetical protein